MTETDKLWIPETWEKEEEGKMIQRLSKGMEQVMQDSEGCTCAYLPYFPTSLTVFSSTSISIVMDRREREGI
jgi:hypothetical protein